MKIEYMSADIETYSSVDLKTSGVYRYSASPDFEILLLGYSVNSGPVTTVDIASGEEIPLEIIEAIASDDVIKWAFNATFERVCLSSWLKRHYPSLFHGYGTGDDYIDYLSPTSWRCSMVWSAYLGLPLSLAGVGKILKLEDQKMTEGKNLVTYFCCPCAPTKSNGGRTRNLPEHDREGWATFKAYNIRDVEVEMAVQKKLSNHPVPDFVWDEYHIDQTINDRGIEIDMALVENAIKFDEISRSSIIAKLQHITGIDNPNSVSQMKTWLSDQGVETETLGKKTVQSLIPETEGEIRDALVLRLQCAKSSIKKYQAMKNTVCNDNRARGMFQFYGANRTGRWCLTGGHEVLTKKGWKRLDEWEGGSIACWDFGTEMVSFKGSKALCFDYEGEMYTYRDSCIDQCSTPDHKMRVKRNLGAAWQNMTVKDMASITPIIPLSGGKEHKSSAEPSYVNVLIMVEAAGNFAEDGSIWFKFKNPEKNARCKKLLQTAEIFFYERTVPGGCTVFETPSCYVPLWLREFNDKTFRGWLFDENPDEFFEEFAFWNGGNAKELRYITTNKTNADIVQGLAHISGRTAVLQKRRTDGYVLDISLGAESTHEITVKPTIEDYSGKVYCAETPTGYFLVRRNGKVWVTGNSGRHIQLQNLRQNHLSDLNGARDLVKSGDYEMLSMLYDDIPDTLSQLVRTAFVPRKGYKFIVSDFSAIEARVLAWLAGEQWVLNVFASGGDIYCETASRMFGVPVEKHGVNGELRQKGKQATLSCIAEGQLVLTDRGLVPIEDVTLEDKVWDGEEWVKHEGVVYKGEREVITYEGLTATPDHLVWIEGKTEPIYFGIAASCGAHLVQTGDGRTAIRLGQNHQSGEEMESEMEPLLCFDAVSGMQSNPVAGPEQPQERTVKGMSELYTTQTDTSLVGPSTNGSKKTMRKPERSSVSKLWSEGNKVQFSKCNSRRIVSNSKIWDSKQRYGVGQDKHECGLCSGECSVLLKERKQQKQKSFNLNSVRAEVLALLRKCSGKKTVIRTDEGCDNSRRSEGCNGEAKALAHNRCKARLYDIRNAGRHHRFTVSGHLVHNCGYGGGVGALKNMGAIEAGMKEEELKPLVDAWRTANPNIVKFWWEMDAAVRKVIREHASVKVRCITLEYRGGMMFMHLPSGRMLSYVKPKLGENDEGNEIITYEGIGNTKKWERIESYGPKFVEQACQGLSRDILAYAMKTLRDMKIVAHVHDELIIECPLETKVEDVSTAMAQLPPWVPGLCLRADGDEMDFYQKA